ncbi:MAG: N-acetyl-gamma-glutamyl-phosphate reductase [Eubacteriaceae bacterium]|nr:N-acetyl-gamma-glutamyl-phosphate reductase [Eubacteriaceae bacterium]
MDTKNRIFIDGSQGTTGLRIHERLADFDGIELLGLSEEERKDPIARKKMLNSADIAFLCLPDDAAIESVSLVENPNTRIIDTSTAHRVSEEFAYGFPELSQMHKNSIRDAKNTAVPGCHATGFLALVYPLIEAGFLGSSAKLTCFSLTGYSGGGKAMIAEYEDEGRSIEYSSPRLYALAQKHKHLNEMQNIAGLEYAPVFNPIVCDFYSGMEVVVPIFSQSLQKKAHPRDLHSAYAEKYSASDFFEVIEFGAEDAYMSSNALSGTDGIQIAVTGNDEAINLIARFDNLGKGASGAAIQCMNIMLGLDEKRGLKLQWPK